MKPRQASELALYHLGGRLMRRLPLSLAQRVAAIVARAAFDVGTKRAGWALTNLRFAYPDASLAERRRIARASYAHFAWNLVDFLRGEQWGEAELRRRIRYEGLEHVRDALAQGRGAIGLTLHLGNFEIAGKALPLFGVPAAAVARPMRNAFLYRRVLDHRKGTGNVVIDRRSAAQEILRQLRAGRYVGFLNDQYMRRSRGVFVPLFGLRCSTSAGRGHKRH